MSETDITHWTQLPGAPAPGTVVCPLDAVSDGVPAMFSFASEDAAAKPFRLLVLRSGDELFGYVNRCAHFGVPLAAKAEQLIFKPHLSVSCNVHYARYRWRDGVCEFGDCEGESLLAVPLIIAAGQICIAVSPAPTF